ncbi:MAG: bifunctional riboflavin kinase/FAD synthetase [Lachnospiraceae bacterium]|nr:bifunctional riboflavin kinase/FAD synthetase [Lachnospiraceae bacterium]
MRIFSDIEEIEHLFSRGFSSAKEEGRGKALAASAVAIGKFDGIHRGHQKLLQTILDAKRERGLLSVVFTFDRPIASIFTEKEIKVLTTNREKRQIFEDLGIDVLIEFPLNHETVAIEPEDFIKSILIRGLHARVAAAGADCSFGHLGRGDFAMLARFGRKHRFDAVEVEKVRYGDEVISSTLIRSHIVNGNMEMAEELLGRSYSIEGDIGHGQKLGSSVLDMPTVNIVPASEKLLPPFGVYFSRVTIDKQIYRGITNIGVRPTVSKGQRVNAETFLYDFEGDLYGKSITLSLLHWHREERRFANLDELKTEMHRDMESGAEYFKKRN